MEPLYLSLQRLSGKEILTAILLNPDASTSCSVFQSHTIFLLPVSHIQT